MNPLSQEELKNKIQSIINFFNSSRYEEVVKKTIPLIKKFPQMYVLDNLLALAHNRLGEYNDAIKVLNRAIKKHPNNIFVLNNLGLVHGNLNNTNIAEEYLKKALTIKPSFLDASITLADLKSKMNKNDEEIIILEKAKNVYEKSYVLNFALGNAYQKKGDFNKSLNCFRSCLEMNPMNTAADKAISLMTKYDKDNIHLGEMKSKLTDINNNENKMWLSFALGKALEDIGEYADSFKHLSVANKIKNEKINYSTDKDERLFNNIKKLFGKRNFPKIEPSNKKIIFIVGMPRSGTTLIEQIISSHGLVYGAGELNHAHDFIEKNFLENTFQFSKKTVDEFEDKDFVNFQEYFLEKINSDKNIITDKAPLNFKWIGFLLIAFPNCKIIHSMRNPMDICWSMYKNFFPSKRLDFSYSLNDLGDYYLLYEDMMSFWNNLFKNKIYNIEYENLIKDSEKEIKNLVNYCDLVWDENCMSFYNNKKSVSTASLFQVRNPIYKSSIEKWKNYSEELKELSEFLTLQS